MGEIVDAARTAVRIWYNDRDISADVAPMLSALEYTDYASGQVDDIQVSLTDPDGRWAGSWYPDSGARLKVDIIQRPSGEAERVLHCGSFVLDAPEYSGPPDMITIKGTSASVTTSLRRQKRARYWVNTTLEQLAHKIAREEGVKIDFHGEDSPPLAKCEQKQESNLEFLLECCRNEGFALKVDSDRLVIYHRAEFDQAAPKLEIANGKSFISSYSFSTDDSDAYRACKLQYNHKDLGVFTVVYTPPNAPEDGPVLCIREHVGSHAEALRRARAKLELANRNRRSGSITLPGDVGYAAGATLRIKGWGKMDGVYAIDEARHSLPGYSVALKMARVG